MFAQGCQAEVVLSEVLVELLKEVEVVALGGRGVTTTLDGRGPPVSPPIALVVVVELLVLVVVDEEREGAEDEVPWVVEEAVAEVLAAGKCLPLIQVCAVAAAFLALALACSCSLACFLSFSAFNFFSFSLVTLSSSSFAFIICALSFRSFLLTSSCVSNISVCLAGALSGAGGLSGALARTLPAWAV